MKIKGLITVFILNIIDIITTTIFYNISFDNGDFKEFNFLYGFYGLQGFFWIKFIIISLLIYGFLKLGDDKRSNRFSLIVGTVYFFVILSNITSIIFYIGK